MNIVGNKTGEDFSSEELVAALKAASADGSEQARRAEARLWLEQKKLEEEKSRAEEKKSISFEDILEGRKVGEVYKPANFSDPVEMLYAVDERFSRGEMQLCNWQAEELRRYSYPRFNKDNPYKTLLCAANGSGKDSYFIAPCAVWSALCRVRSRFIITSSSFNQLKNQTEPGIRSIALNVNKFFGEEVLYLKQFHIVAKNTGSEILIFATDEAGLAEGYHPFPDSESQMMTICINESKTVKNEIFGALKRCKGYTHWMEVSSAGGVSGHFYDTFIHATQHPDKYPYGKGFFARRVTSYECHHISSKEIEADKNELGEFSELFRSIHLSEFTSADEQVVIPRELLNRALRAEVAAQTGKTYVGLDFSRGGDETAGVVVVGNVVQELRCCRINESNNLVVELCRWLTEWKVRYGEFTINADDGGIGAVVIDMIKRNGWSVNRVHNQSGAINKSRYRNRGAELWYNLRILLEHCKLSFNVKDQKMFDQISSRYYKRTDSGIIKLESKHEARASGHASPDRADALVLALANVKLGDIEEKELGEPVGKKHSVSVEELLDMDFIPERKVEKKNVGSSLGGRIREFFNMKKGSL